MSGESFDRLEELVVELLRRYRELKRERDRLVARVRELERDRKLAVERLKRLLSKLDEFEKGY